MWFTMAALAFECGFQPPVQSVSTVAPKDGDGPGVRDAFGTFTTHETEHFALKWGPQINPTSDQIEAIALDLESTWSAQVDRLGWMPPPSTDAYKLNIYLGSTGAGIPVITFEGGYVWLDPEGFPMMVLTPSLLEYYDLDSTIGLTLIAHEFNHAVQLGVGSDNFLEGDAFFWEATANFIVPYSTELPPETTAFSWGAYLINPQFSWTTHSDVLTVAPVPRSGRQYQAAMFLYDLAENKGHGQELIRDAWHSGLDDSVVNTLDRALDGELAENYASFAVTHATEQHPLAGTYEWGVEATLEASGFQDRRITERVPDEGAQNARVPTWLQPEGLGWNRVRWNSEIIGEVTIEVVPDASGTEGTPSELSAWLVEGGEFPTWQRIDGTITLPVDDETSFDIILATGPGEDRERFGYTYSVTPSGEVPIDDPPSELRPEDRREFVLGCSTVPGSLNLLWLVVPMLFRRNR